MIELALNKIQKYYGAAMALKNITFEVMTGDRVGIVGDNGCGKTTLFKIISGVEGYDNGILTIRKGAHLGYLEQMPHYPKGYKGIDVLREAFSYIDDIEKSMKDIETNMSLDVNKNIEKLLEDYSKLQYRFEAREKQVKAGRNHV